MKVLVIDYDQCSLQIICIMLEQCGHKATKCTSGTEGLKMLRKNAGEFDIVLTDVCMPDINGFHLLEKIGMDLPVVLLSEDSSYEMKVEGLKQGAYDYLIKPVKMEELEKIGQHVLNWRKANKGTVDDDEDGNFLVEIEKLKQLDDMLTLLRINEGIVDDNGAVNGEGSSYINDDYGYGYDYDYDYCYDYGYGYGYGDVDGDGDYDSDYGNDGGVNNGDY